MGLFLLWVLSLICGCCERVHFFVDVFILMWVCLFLYWAFAFIIGVLVLKWACSFYYGRIRFIVGVVCRFIRTYVFRTAPYSRASR